MGKLKRKLKYPAIKKHRLDVYVKCINDLIDGKDTPAHVAIRAKKMNEIKDTKI